MKALSYLKKPFIVAMSALLAFGGSVQAAPKVEEKTPLSERGKTLLEKYTKMLEELSSQVKGALPPVDEAKKAAFMAARSEWNTLKEPDEDAPPTAKKTFTETRDQIEAKAIAAARLLLADLDGFLGSDKLDGALMKIAILTHSTPHGMAEFAQAGEAQEKMLDGLLADPALMKQMLEAGGANGGSYGDALEIYAAIQKASERSREVGSIFQRLALGTSLHNPWKNGKEKIGVYGIVHRGELNDDQVDRYMHYEKAYLDGELDPAFKDMTTWECRFITDDMHSNEDLAWMRQMMRTYRPDHISNPDYKWRYARIVKSDVPYCTTTHDPSLGSPAQEAIALGGVCGRRAFFGRLSLRAFGIPTRASTQTGHAALSHWTPDGWTICFGGWWSVAWCGPQGGLDILLETQARKSFGEFFKVLRAQWIADALGEENVDLRFYGKGGGFWESLAFCKKQVLVKDAEIKALELTGGDLGESDHLTGDEVGKEIEIPEEYKKIVAAPDGVISIPAVACYSPSKASDRVVFMKTWDNKDYQLHYSRLGERPELVKYKVEVPAAGEYELTAKLATVSIKQEMIFRINREEPVSHGIPFSKGAWMDMAPLKVKLEEGKNTISITARAPNRGVSLKSLQLKPVK